MTFTDEEKRGLMAAALAIPKVSTPSPTPFVPYVNAWGPRSVRTHRLGRTFYLVQQPDPWPHLAHLQKAMAR